MSRRVLVFGPVYLDRVLRVDGPLVPPEQGGPLDGSARAVVRNDRPGGLVLKDSVGQIIEVATPADWPGPTGTIGLAGPFLGEPPAWDVRRVTAVSWTDDLGGMGAGYAAALGGELRCVLGDPADGRSETIVGLLDRHAVAHRALRRKGTEAEWSLVVSSGPHGDKLAIGFRGGDLVADEGRKLRGCFDGYEPEPSNDFVCGPSDLRIVAGWPGDLAAWALRSGSETARLYAPNLRNMGSVPKLARDGLIDLLCCNRGEWNALPGAEAIRGSIPLVSVTDGPAGASLYVRQPDGTDQVVRIPAFPRTHPPRDTNRAGEAYASALASSLLDQGWRGGPAAASIVQTAALRASAAAALVLDLEAFGFPDDRAIDRALERGIVD